MPAEDDFEKKSHEFLEWFRRQPGTYFHPDLEIADLRGRNAGRGIVATKRIEADTDLFSIPRSIVITTQNSTLAKKHPAILEWLASNEDQEEEQATEANWLALVITLMFEDFTRDVSAWKPYLAVLPRKFDTLMFWSDDELKELQASAVRDKVGKAEADELFKTKLLPFIHEHAHIFFSPGQAKPSDEELLRQAHRMSSAIMAYAFDLEKNDEDEDEQAEWEDGWVEDKEVQTLGMVPMADMLNADAEFNAHLAHGEESLTMTSLRVIQAGEEVLNYYGPLPNSDLLRRYGYTSAKNSVHDVVEMSWGTVVAATKEQLGLTDEAMQKALASIDADEIEEGFVIERQPVEPSSDGLLPKTSNKVQALPDELLMQTAALLRAISLSISVSEVDSSTKVLEVVRGAITSRLSEYITSAGRDEMLLRDATGHLQMAIVVRLEEKRILQEALELISRKIEENSNGALEKPSKRQRTE